MKVGTLPLSGAACAGGRAVARSLCVQDVGGGLSGLAALISDESALEVAMRYTNRQPLPFLYVFIGFLWWRLRRQV